MPCNQSLPGTFTEDIRGIRHKMLEAESRMHRWAERMCGWLSGHRIKEQLYDSGPAQTQVLIQCHSKLTFNRCWWQRDLTDLSVENKPSLRDYFTGWKHHEIMVTAWNCLYLRGRKERPSLQNVLWLISKGTPSAREAEQIYKRMSANFPQTLMSKNCSP